MPGREERFTALVHDLAAPVRAYAVRRCPPDLVDDVVAETFVVLWRRLDDVPEAALPYAYGVARRVAANARRGVRRQAALVDRVGRLDLPGAEDLPEHPEVHAALAGLGELDREVVRLWAWEGLPPREIATVLDLTPNAAALRLSRARARLRRELGHPPGQDPPAAGHDRDEGEEGGDP